jgi:hypothetical protein
LTSLGLKAATSIIPVADLPAEESKRGADGDEGRASAERAVSSPQLAHASTPRQGSKISQVLILLQREQGATLEEIVQATGWLAHTARAALTGLRKRGVAIERQERATGPRSYVAIAAQLKAA